MFARLFIAILMLFILSSCVVGPNYKRPVTVVPEKFKEAPKGWKVAQPQDTYPNGEWWKIFKDSELNQLEAQLNINNQTIQQAVGQYLQAKAVIDEARAAYFPTVSGSLSIIRQKTPALVSIPNGTVISPTTSSGSSGSSSSAGGGGGGSSSSGTPFTTEALILTASWEPDIWGAVRRTVEADVASAEASAAQIAAIRLSSQASLVQYYFEMRGLDTDQVLLDKTAIDYKKILQLTKYLHDSGVVSLADVLQAKSQYETASAAAINNHINRALYEHAIATLIGKPASCVVIKRRPLTQGPPAIPVAIPTILLERRPDIASAERLMAEANAQIGVAISAFFPTLTLTGNGNMIGHGSFGNFLSHPLFGWSLGPELTQLIYDGGLRAATVRAARAAYETNVAAYRQTVLAAFQDVEDNLASLRLLKAQTHELKKAAIDAKNGLKLVIDQYKQGTVPFSSVITAEITAFTAEKSVSDVNYLQMTAAVGLIRSLGGGWDGCLSPKFCKLYHNQ